MHHAHNPQPTHQSPFPASSTMAFGKGGVNKKKNARSHVRKADRAQDNNAMNSANKKQKVLPTDLPKLSTRESHGLIPLTEQMIRCKIIVDYALRYREPSKEAWPSIIKDLAAELPTGSSEETIRQLFTELSQGEVRIDRREGSGRKRKLGPDNPGLAAAALALNSGVSWQMATDICNQTNKRLSTNPDEEVLTVSRSTLTETIKRYTDVKEQAILRRKTGRRDTESDWAKARVVRCQMTKDMYELGEKLENGTLTMADCRQKNLHPLYEDATVYVDQSHMKAVPAGGSGHSGSKGRIQTRIAVDPKTGKLLPVARGGVMPARRMQIKPKFDSQAQGCYAVAVPKDANGKTKALFLKTFDYTGKKIYSAKDMKTHDEAELKRAKENTSNHHWKNFNGDNPYKEKFGTKSAYKLPDNPTDWEREWEITQQKWYQTFRSCSKMNRKASICDFVLHLIKEGEELYKGTNRENTWMIWHDALSILWEKETQTWLRTLKCPVEGWEDRTWADRFVRFRGKYNDQVAAYYKDSLPGDSPELMPLDCRLFSDVKEGTARNVSFSYFLPDDDPDKYSLATPRKVYDAIHRTIASGCPSQDRIREDIETIKRETLDRIIAAKGGYIEDSARGGVRRVAQAEENERRGAAAAAARKEDKQANTVDKKVLVKFEALVDSIGAGEGLPYMEQPAVLTEARDDDGNDELGELDGPPPLKTDLREVFFGRCREPMSEIFSLSNKPLCLPLCRAIRLTG